MIPCAGGCGGTGMDARNGKASIMTGNVLNEGDKGMSTEQQEKQLMVKGANDE